VTSDYVTLGFIAGQFGPEPFPNKALVNYQRLHNIAAGSSQTATLNLTLASLARVDENGNKVVYPGSYTLQIDTQPLTSVDFTLTGSQLVVDQWPAPPPYKQQNTAGVGGVGPDYYVPGYGSEETPV
jgi:beta-D-xylosidase 4